MLRLQFFNRWVLAAAVRCLAGLILGSLVLLTVRGQEAVTLRPERMPDGRVVCDSLGPVQSVHLLEQSADLIHWRERARTHERFEAFPLTTSAVDGESRAYFRAGARPKTADDDWKNQILGPSDPFFSGSGSDGIGGMRWVKFTLRLDQADRVYFQDSIRYPFHYPFAVKRLSGFETLTPEAFDAVTLSENGQRLVLGAVLVPADSSLRELGIQIVGRQPFPVSRVADWLKTVRSALALPSGWTVFYLPTFEQGSLSAEDSASLSAQGFPVSTPARWVAGDEIYSAGWAFGRLKYVPAGGIAAAYAEGQLRHSDILLTDAVPAEIPLLAGTLALSPATPNSHVAILSQSFGVPFAFVSAETTQRQLRGWEGQEVLLLAERTAAGSTVRTMNVQGLLTERQRELLMQAKQLAPLNLTPSAHRGTLSLPVRDLTPGDIRFVGGKAANFGVLSRALPDSTPEPVIAFTFDLWQSFLDQVLSPGLTLRAAITERLQGYTFPPNAAGLTRALAEIRGLIRDEADFSPSQRAEILAALAPFGTTEKIRFRSSTNVEDSEQFSGAGLYDSYSGCLLDDLDDDTAGPSHCDPSEGGERGVFRALRRVYASFYNDNAFIERLRHGVDETTVGMAVLVHPSFPDETELANGVATLRVNLAATPDLDSYSGELVTQEGAVSVSNPEGNARPEVVSLTRPPGGSAAFDVQRRSSLVPLGGTVLRWPEEYPQLFQKLETATREYARTHPDRRGFVLDFEYKKIAPDRLVVKQIREVPTPAPATNPPPFQLSDAGRFEVFQHHGKDLYANHRLKSVWQFQSLVFPGEPGGAGFDFFVDLERQEDTAVRRTSGRMSSFPEAVSTVSGKTLEYRWKWNEGALRGRYRLTATFEQNLNVARPVPLGAALNVELSVTYDEPQVVFDADGTRRTVTSETTRLVPLERIIEGSLPRKVVARRGGIVIESAYTLAFLKWGVPGVGIFDTKSFPLVQWRGTTLTGLTSRPITLLGTFSQTYDSIRHNFFETFLFEPGREPGIDPDLRAELRAANIKAIRLSLSADNVFPGPGSQPDLRFWGFDDLLRIAD